MCYEDFVSECAGAKDTWGINFFQIEGENGYIYVKDGSNGLAELRVVTKVSDETFNEQEHENRWFYEIKELIQLILNEEYDEIYHRLDITINVIEIIEAARLTAGIFFPADK